jgi:hypothetical protein
MCTNLGLGIIELHPQNQGRHYEIVIIKSVTSTAIPITSNLHIKVKDFYPLEYIHKDEISYETYEKNDSFSICVL